MRSANANLQCRPLRNRFQGQTWGEIYCNSPKLVLEEFANKLNKREWYQCKSWTSRKHQNEKQRSSKTFEDIETE